MKGRSIISLVNYFHCQIVCSTLFPVLPTRWNLLSLSILLSLVLKSENRCSSCIILFSIAWSGIMLSFNLLKHFRFFLPLCIGFTFQALIIIIALFWICFVSLKLPWSVAQNWIQYLRWDSIRTKWFGNYSSIDTV